MIPKTHITLDDLLAELPGGINTSSGAKIHKAYTFAAEAHADHTSDTGESYMAHNLAVAHAMIQLDVDANTIAASLLLDTLLPHTNRTAVDLSEQFDEEVVSLVTGLQNLYAYSEKEHYRRSQAGLDTGQHKLETVRRAILSIIEGDIRIILIRMADCLQDMRHASRLPTERRLEVANEAMHIYAPLANRLGVWQLKWELEDLAFRYLEPQRYREIASKLAERRTERAKKIDTAAGQLRRRLETMNLQAEVTGRPKHIYSIYRKMQRKGVDNIEHIYDIQALRVILQPVNPERYRQLSTKEKEEEDRGLCYQVLGAVHSLWQPIPREFDDYIASPKPNGYRSLHTAVIDTRTGQTLEVQIRTIRMHEEAEKGVAAHWAYKEGGTRVSASAQRRIQGLRELLTAIQESEGPEPNSTAFETEIQAERIYVFTPNEDVVELPAGSTPIDFAYQVHTEVGHRCRGARVNGKMVSLDYRLKSGEKVEIITTKRAGPSRDWMNSTLGYTGSARTRSKIRQWF
ncbi:MAG: bifunctional (p)ppGpp synthetase/guanosine-3',5'-bis(diphosphate) 3'-pyrophosphohydrolase, partial [Anaerolineales bacterium]|nr:bifunctional (p)ppGpp synthetase/guanosine-3',5'-bis(diphosphate) 3'-pyrophosphohydrolase [Anaerolineales bacterium]